MNRKRLSYRTVLKDELEAKTQKMHSDLDKHQQTYNDLKSNARKEIEEKIKRIETELSVIKNKFDKSWFLKAFYTIIYIGICQGGFHRLPYPVNIGVK